MRSNCFTNKEAIASIILDCQVCYVGMVDKDNTPYVVPFNFGYDDGYIYLHSAREGRKMDILKKNNRVCVTFSTGHELRHQSEGVACSYSMKFRQLNATIQNAIADVMFKYYNVVQQQNFVSTLNQSIEVSKQKLALIKAKTNIGLLSDSELLQAQIDLNAQTQALQVQNITIEQSKDDLLRSMVLAPNTDIIVKDTVLVDRDISWENIAENLKKNPALLPHARPPGLR